jgi:hypothetical protein
MPFVTFGGVEPPKIQYSSKGRASRPALPEEPRGCASERVRRRENRGQ